VTGTRRTCGRFQGIGRGFSLGRGVERRFLSTARAVPRFPDSERDPRSPTLLSACTQRALHVQRIAREHAGRQQLSSHADEVLLRPAVLGARGQAPGGMVAVAGRLTCGASANLAGGRQGRLPLETKDS